MEIEINENNNSTVIFDQEEMYAISVLNWEENEYIDGYISPSIGVVIAIDLHYYKGVSIFDPTTEKCLIRWIDQYCNVVDANQAPWPSMPAKYIGALIQMAYEDEEKRNEIKKKLDQFVDLCEKANEIGVSGWNYPTHEKVNAIWNSFILCEYRHNRYEDLASPYIDAQIESIKNVFNIDLAGEDEDEIKKYYGLIPATFSEEDFHPIFNWEDLEDYEEVFKEVHTKSIYTIKIVYNPQYCIIEMV